MTLDELLEEARQFEPTAADFAAMEARLAKAEAEFAAEAKAKHPTGEWLNLECTI